MNIISNSTVFQQSKCNFSVKDNMPNQVKLNQLNTDSMSFTGKVDKLIEKVLKNQNVSYSEIINILNNVAYEVGGKVSRSHKLYTIDRNIDFSNPKQEDFGKFIALVLGKKEPPKALVKELQKFLDLTGCKLNGGKLIRNTEIGFSEQSRKSC